MLTPKLKEAQDAFQRGNFARAKELAQEGIAIEASPQWQHLLGLIHCRQGNPSAGAEWLCRASEADPDNLAFQVVAMRALVDAGRAEEVLKREEPPLITSAVSLALWQARGEAADVAGDWVASEAAWRTVSRAVPSDFRAWSNLGSALAVQGRWEEAAQALQSAVLINPAEPLLRRNLAVALSSAGLHEGALQASREWVRIAGPTPEEAILRAHSLEALQKFDEAERAYEAALELAPGDPQGWIGLGLVYERTARTNRLPALIEAAEQEGIGQKQLGYLPVLCALHEGRVEDADALLEAADRNLDAVQWYRLKSRIAERRHQYAAAFEAAASMNRSTKDFESWVRRGAEYRKRLRAIENAIAPSSSSRVAFNDGPSPPVFLVGFPRSGTTLLDTFLMGHSGIRVLEELPLITEVEKICPVAQANDCPVETVRMARDAYFSALASHVDRNFDGLIVDKMPLNMLAVPLIHAIIPGSKFIFAQRHPCDAVLSGFMQSFIASEPMSSFLTIEGAADFYDAAMSLWLKSSAAFEIASHKVIYEELVEDPRAVLEPLIGFLGLPWEERLLDHRSSAQSRGMVVTPSYNQITERLSNGAIDRWKLYQDQLDDVLPVLLPWAERLGYHG